MSASGLAWRTPESVETTTVEGGATYRAAALCAQHRRAKPHKDSPAELVGTQVFAGGRGHSPHPTVVGFWVLQIPQTPYRIPIVGGLVGTLHVVDATPTRYVAQQSLQAWRPSVWVLWIIHAGRRNEACDSNCCSARLRIAPIARRQLPEHLADPNLGVAAPLHHELLGEPAAVCRQ